MARNGKTNMNPAGSSHGEQLVPKRLTLKDNDIKEEEEAWRASD